MAAPRPSGCPRERSAPAETGHPPRRHQALMPGLPGRAILCRAGWEATAAFSAASASLALPGWKRRRRTPARPDAHPPPRAPRSGSRVPWRGPGGPVPSAARPCSAALTSRVPGRPGRAGRCTAAPRSGARCGAAHSRRSRSAVFWGWPVLAGAPRSGCNRRAPSPPARPWPRPPRRLRAAQAAAAAAGDELRQAWRWAGAPGRVSTPAPSPAPPRGPPPGPATEGGGLPAGLSSVRLEHRWRPGQTGPRAPDGANHSQPSEHGQSANPLCPELGRSFPTGGCSLPGNPEGSRVT